MKIFDYKSDGNTVIAKRGNGLKRLSDICYIMEDEYNPGWRSVYVYYPSIDSGVQVSRSVSLSDEQIINAVEREYPTPEEYARKTLAASEKGSFIKDTQIVMINTFDAVTAAKLRENKREWKIKREQFEQREAAERAERNARELEQKRAEETDKYNKFLAELKRGGRVSIPSITEYQTLSEYKTSSALTVLARNSGVKIPLRTAGFVENKVTGLYIEGGRLKGYYADGESLSFWDYYADIVEDAIMEG